MSNVISKAIAPVIAASVRKLMSSGLGLFNPVFGHKPVSFSFPKTALDSYNALPNKTVLTEFASGHGWNSNKGGSHNYSATTGSIIGSRHFRITTDGTGSSKYCQDVPLIASYDLTGKNIAILCKFDNVDDLHEIQLTMGNNGGLLSGSRIRYSNIEGSQGTKWLEPNRWHCLIVPLNSKNNNASFDFTDVSAFRLSIRDKNSTPITMQIQAVAAYTPTASAGASIIFDDAHDSVWNKAVPYMTARGVKGSIAAPHDALNTGSYMTLPQLQELQNDHGWEIVGHATGNDQRVEGRATVEAFLTSQRAYWKANDLFVYGWVYAGGEYGPYTDDPTRTIRDSVEDAGFEWARVIHERFQPSLPVNDAFKLSTVYVNNVDTVLTLTNQIDDALEAGLFPIIVFHRITDTNADQSTEYLTANFEAIIDHLVNNNIDVDIPSKIIQRVS